MNAIIPTISSLLDQPGFQWKYIIIGISTGNFLFESYLKLRQLKNISDHNSKGNQIPKVLDGKIDKETVLKSSNYSLAKLKFSLFSSLYSLISDVAFLKFNVLPKTWEFASSLIKFLPSFIPGGEITKSLLFLGTFTIASTLLSLPLDYYSNFVIEEKFGFNKLTVKLWLSDMVKQLLVTFVVSVPILSGFLKIVEKFGDSFMYYLSVFLFVVQVVMILIYPKFIQPLFNKLTLLEPGELKDSIEKLANENKFPLDKLYVIDGSKRSAHSNAYFMGLPWGSKQIVIYDTLIEKSTVPETTAVLGHEIGHWFLSHTTKLLLISQVHIFTIFTMFAAFVKNKSLFNSMGFYKEQPTLIGFVLFGDILKPIDAILQFLMNILSRKYEYEADKFATDLGYADELKEALIKLHKENLSSLSVDWLYSAYNYNHPHLTERIDYIDECEVNQIAKKQD